MAQTFEEKLAKLKEHDNWWRITDSQREFLEGMANGMKPLEAMKRAYPDMKSAAAVLATKQMLTRVGIQQMLATIGIDIETHNVSKKEAITLLSRQLRKCTDASEMVKLLALYSKLNGWNLQDNAEPVEKEVDINELVSAVEKKRKGK